MNLAISPINNNMSLQNVAFNGRPKTLSVDEVIKRRNELFDTSKDTVDSLRKKVFYQENRYSAERDYYKSLTDEREAKRVKQTLDRMEFELKTLRKAFVDLLKKAK